MENGKEGMKCGCMHHKATPVLIVLLGLDFLAYNMGWGISDMFLNISWPIIVIAIGIMKMCGGMCKCCSKDR